MTRRIDRLNEQFRAEISDLLLRQAKDPRLNAMVSVTRVNISPDLSYARVFVSVLGEEAQRKEVLQGLSAAANFFRHELRGRLRLRYIPVLDFRYDDSIEQAAHVLKVMRQVEAEEGQGQGASAKD